MTEESTATATATEPDDEPTARVARWEWLALTGVLAAFVVGMISAVAQGWVPVSDLALAELKVRDVPGHLPTLGAYSRFGWSHPGPAQYVLLSVPYRLLGSASWALLVATLLVNLAAVGASWRIARAHGRLAGAVVLLGTMVLVAGRPAGDLRNPWNPFIGLVLAATLVVIAWAVAQRRAWPTVALLPVATLLVQSHIGYGAMVAPVVAVAVLLALLPRRGSDSELDRAAEVPWRAWGLGVALTLLLWAPPLVEQLRGDPGNLTLLARSGTGTGDAAGWGTALRVISNAFAVPPSWAGRPVPTYLSGMVPDWRVPLLALPPVAAIVLAVRRRSMVHLRALAVATAGVLGAVVGVAQVHGRVFEYLVPWIGSVVSVLVALSCWTILDLQLRAARPRQLVATALSVATLAVCVPVAVWQVPAAALDTPIGVVVEQLAPELVDDADGRPVSIDSDLDFDAAAVAPGLVLASEKAGLDTAARGEASIRFGSHRADDGSPERVDYLVATVARAADLSAEGWETVAVHDPFSAAERASIAELLDERRGYAERADRLAPEDPERLDLERALIRNVARTERVKDGRLSMALLREAAVNENTAANENPAAN